MRDMKGTVCVLALCGLLLSSGCALILEYPITSASVGVLGATGKGPADHALSNVAGQDCEVVRVVDLQPVCQDKVPTRVEERRFQPVGSGR